MPEHVDTAHKTLIGPRPHAFFAVHISSHQPTVKLEPLLGSLTISFSDHCRRAVIVVTARRLASLGCSNGRPLHPTLIANIARSITSRQAAPELRRTACPSSM